MMDYYVPTYFKVKARSDEDARRMVHDALEPDPDGYMAPNVDFLGFDWPLEELHCLRGCSPKYGMEDGEGYHVDGCHNFRKRGSWDT